MNEIYFNEIKKIEHINKIKLCLEIYIIDTLCREFIKVAAEMYEYTQFGKKVEIK